MLYLFFITNFNATLTLHQKEREILKLKTEPHYLFLCKDGDVKELCLVVNFLIAFHCVPLAII